MECKAKIHVNSLKDFLLLFKRETKIHNLELGDTGYQKEGFIDKKIFGLSTITVQNILEFEYDFNGLVLFQAQIDGFEINFISDFEIRFRTFCISGSDFKLRNLQNKIIELNCLSENQQYFYEAVF